MGIQKLQTPSVSLLLCFIQLHNNTQKSKIKKKTQNFGLRVLTALVEGVCVFVYVCIVWAEGQSGEVLEHCLLSSMYSWGPACLRVWTVTCETRKKQDTAPLCLLKNTQRMDCHYKTNPSACIPPVHQTLPVEQDMTQSGKGSYAKIYFVVRWLAICSEVVSSLTFICDPRKRHASTSSDEHKFSLSLRPLSRNMCILIQTQSESGSQRKRLGRTLYPTGCACKYSKQRREIKTSQWFQIFHF